MSTVAPGLYVDPIDASTLRYWDGQKWTVHIQSRKGGHAMTSSASHVGAAEPAPTIEPTVDSPAPEPSTAPTANPKSSGQGGLVLASVWALAAVIIGGMVISGAESEAYGGDAYTGMQNATVQVAKAVGWLILSTGPLGLINALSRR